ncbi:hypothetical protein BDZ97DRAFT_2062811 [Flammula alnicola]|nr:hypothetical protein BDZ97DRAFT_2062811 [Flammula alnicola]
MPKVTRQTAKKARALASSSDVAEQSPAPVKIEDAEEPAAENLIYRPIMQVHFDELALIWPNDRRIPSISSRRAWALARNLNPVNVHSWWYRRRTHAKRLRIKIPQGTYELDVGVPPVIVEVPVKEEISAPEDLPAAASGTVTEANSKSDHSSSNDIPSSSTDPQLATSLSSDATVYSPNDFSVHFVDQDDHKRAYSRVSSPLEHSGLASSPGPVSYLEASSPRESSPLPPSSPPLRSPSPPLLFLPTTTEDPDTNTDSPTNTHDDAVPSLGSQNMYQDLDSAWTPFSLLEGFYPAYVLPPKSITIARSSCAASAVNNIAFATASDDTAERANNTDEKHANNEVLPEEAPWCLGGFRVACDGSLLGLCSRCCVANPVSV